MDKIQQRLRDEAMRLHAEWRVEDVVRRAQTRSRARRLGPYVVGLGGLALVVAILTTLGTKGATNVPAASPDLSPVSPGTCDYGPWLRECPEADWVRSALSAAGAEVVDETDSAFVITHPEGEALFWAMDPAHHSGVEPLEQEVAESTLSLVRTVEGMDLYHGSGEWGWSVHGLNVWIAEYSGKPPPVAMIVELMRITASVPYH